MVNGDIIDREEKVLFIDNNENTHTFRKIVNNIIDPEDGTPEEVIEYVKKNSEYVLETELDFPLKVSTSHHLEGKVGRNLEYEYSEKLENIIQQGKVDLPSIEVHEKWKVYEDGSAELVSVEYNNEEYTK